MVAGGAYMVAGGGGMHGGRGVCVVVGGMRGCGGMGMCCCGGGMCGCRVVCVVAGGCVGYNEIRSMSGQYASYWNAFLC